jgi:hypothetical protein
MDFIAKKVNKIKIKKKYNLNIMKEIIEKLNNLNIIQKNYEFEEDLPEEMLKYFTKSLASELDIDKHRWYETSVSVWETNEGLLGVRSITNLYSEQSDYEDISWKLRFFEMEPIQTITYKIKK